MMREVRTAVHVFARGVAAAVVALACMAGCGGVARDVARQTEILTVDTLKRVSALKKAQTEFEERIQSVLAPDGGLGGAVEIKQLLDSNRHQALGIAGAIAAAPSGSILARLQSELVASVVASGDRDAAKLLASFQQPAEARRRWAELEAAEQQLTTLRKKLKELAATETLKEYLAEVQKFLKQLEAKQEGDDGEAARSK